jgi:tRNA-2-methylthio-N6-dimethylallyladenosine synthase
LFVRKDSKLDYNNKTNIINKKININLLNNKLKNKKYYLKTYGCQMNINDASTAGEIFNKYDMKRTPNKDDADLIFISTCCVREKAELKVYSYIGSLRALKDKNKDLIIIVSGCMSEQDEVKSAITRRFPFVDIIMGTGQIGVLPEYLSEKISKEKRINKKINFAQKEALPLRKAERVSEFVTIMTGCDNFCSYCIVPHVRGREVSRNPQEIIDEVNHMVAQGCSEVTLLGQNVNSYGKDFGDIDFPSLLQRVNDETDVKRIRFLTSHPKDINYKVLDTMSNNQKLCKHIHLPIQSGSDSILKKMNRKYDTNRYLDIIKYARNVMPNIEFTTDIIVGFPGETEDDFKATLDIVREVRYASAFMFKYSKRTGTPAANYENQVPEDIKSRRLNELMSLEAKIKKEVYSSYIGKEQEVLIEDHSSIGDNYSGKTCASMTVNCNGNKKDVGNIIKVKILKAKTNSLLGEVIR